MRFASLGSGSAGNALVAEAGGTTLLLDCGFGLRETLHRLARLDIEVENLSGILITHEHDDHAGSAAKLAARFNIPLFITYGTFTALGELPSNVPINIIDSHTAFSVGGIEVHPYPVPHDCREPVQYVLADGNHRLGVLTDTGMSTPHIEAMLSGCDALVLECNHDLEMLSKGIYPPSLKKRISSRYGHLDNASSAALLSRLDRQRLQHVIAAHLSEANNHPDLARQALSEVLNCKNEWVGIADQATGFDWREIL